MPALHPSFPARLAAQQPAKRTTQSLIARVPRLSPFPPSARVLDVGGWFSPYNAATHVVDLLPYETRRGCLASTVQPQECFTRATWTQVDFLTPGLRLPFDDGYFDHVYCGNTLEDLIDPIPLLREITRVGRGGRIVSPSRAAEQTVGIRDRLSRRPGHPHHHWIIDAYSHGLEFCRKDLSLLDKSNLIPLTLFEISTRNNPASATLDWSWSGPLRWTICDDNTARERAATFASTIPITRLARWHDALIRAARRQRKQLLFFRSKEPSPNDWWQTMLQLSRPYSTIPL